MHFRRHKPSLRTRSGRGGYERAKRKYPRLADFIWLGMWPASHDILHHRRKPRRADKALELAARLGRVDVERESWPNWRQPHHYWW